MGGCGCGGSGQASQRAAQLAARRRESAARPATEGPNAPGYYSGPEGRPKPEQK